MNNKYTPPIKLAPPGAGVGFFTELFLKLYVKPFITRKASWDSCEKSFIKMHKRILETLTKIPKEKVEIPILVPSQRGLEDSSRYWSAKMVLEHLLIVGTQVQDAIVKLSHGEEINAVVKTENVKPQGETSYESTLETFRRFGDELPVFLNKKVKDKNSKTELKHPWFGNFTCKDWYWMMGMHTMIHNQQLKAIVAGLNSQHEN